VCAVRWQACYGVDRQGYGVSISRAIVNSAVSGQGIDYLNHIDSHRWIPLAEQCQRLLSVDAHVSGPKDVSESDSL
jgi:hypothetical protein